ncbi:MAG: hypothetical protein S4CHLAM45_08060 [Chlamydiales bacterium]|nr:hypothetical protein [Chlamydiales bacterium]MCH9620442.1 hypothetical protein [Chlamydiales bacterium]MCH9622912.1 hypothetical protein [Chlamydiales bacterium]
MNSLKDCCSNQIGERLIHVGTHAIILPIVIGGSTIDVFLRSIGNILRLGGDPTYVHRYRIGAFATLSSLPCELILKLLNPKLRSIEFYIEDVSLQTHILNLREIIQPNHCFMREVVTRIAAPLIFVMTTVMRVIDIVKGFFAFIGSLITLGRSENLYIHASVGFTSIGLLISDVFRTVITLANPTAFISDGDEEAKHPVERIYEYLNL